MATADPAVVRELDALERALAGFVRGELSQVAYEFTRAVRGSTELTAAVFRVSTIRGMWRPRVPAIMRRVLGVAQASVDRLARQVGIRRLPPGWSDLSSPSRLPAELQSWAEEVTGRLLQVGDTMAEEAIRELAEGLSQGENQAQLEARMIAAFNRNSAFMGPDRADRIAATEAVSSWNAAALGFAQAASATGIGLSKRWVTRNDNKVRAAHERVAGHSKPLQEPFMVADHRMQYPGDPTAPPELTINCRCVLQIERTAVAAAVAEMGTGMVDPEVVAELQSRMPPQLKEYWLAGPGAAKIGWGTPGAFKRCVRALHGKFPEDTEGLCANLYHEATGRWPGQNHSGEVQVYDETGNVMADPQMDSQPVSWTTTGSALAFENVQTGDGRAFAPGSLYWDEGPKPLMYADEIGEGHEGAQLAGTIFMVLRDGDRINAAGVLYPSMDAGAEAIDALSEGAPLGVSVDLDDVSFDLVDMGGPGNPPDEVPTDQLPAYQGHLITASLTMQPGGGFLLTGETASEWVSSGLSLAGEASKVTFHVGADGMVPMAAFTPDGATSFDVTAAAGDPATGGTVVESQTSGQYLMRITRARLRGATLVLLPAFADARIVLDGTDQGPVVVASVDQGGDTAGYDAVVARVNGSDLPATASVLAHQLSMGVGTVKRHLSTAAQKGFIVRIARGTYIRSESGSPDPNPFRTALDARTASDGIPGEPTWDALTAAVTGAVDLPVASRDHAWDGPGAEGRVFDWAAGDCAKLNKAFAYTDSSADCTTKAAHKLGYADVINGTLTIIPRGVFAAQAALAGARGGTSIPASEVGAVKSRLEKVRVHVDQATGQDGQQKMEASAWSAVKDLPPMPADWFTEPTAEELPSDMGGVHYSNGRIFGWVARAGEPHAGFAKKITIESLGRIDTTHFLRQKFTLDNGEAVRAGALTMNTGHHRDGAECETSACAFDDTRTVAGIVTVGMNERGMWFSGAAHPTLSEWDRRVFLACEPSYHLRKGGNGAWQLRGVLTVPVPGHSTPMVASLVQGVIERGNLALTAAAEMADVEEAIAAAEEAQTAAAPPTVDVVAALDYDLLADRMVAAMARADEKRQRDAEELAALLQEAQSLAASGDPEQGAAGGYDDHTIGNAITTDQGA